MYTVDFLLNAADQFNQLSQLVKVSFIKKMPDGKYKVVSSKGRNLGVYPTKEQAEKRLKQVEFFKYLSKKKKKIKKKAAKKLDLTKIEAFSLSSIMRQINKQLGKEECKKFMSLYKDMFDKKVLSKSRNPEKSALTHALQHFEEEYDLDFNKKLLKSAAAPPQLGDPQLVGKYLANIITFTLNRISAQRRPKSINNVKHKLYNLNEMEISQKKMPPSSSMGQSITFVKHVLFGQDPKYVRQVLNHIVRFL